MTSFPVVNGVTTYMEPPEGVVVDFEHPRSQAETEHFAVFGFLGSLAFLCLIQRLYTKHFIAGGLRVDDYLFTAAWAATIGLQSVQIWSISIGGLCHHAWEMPIEVYTKHMLSSFIGAPLFMTCNGLSKLSLLTFYLRISDQKWFRIAIWSAMGLVVTYTVVINMLLLFGTQPIRANWDPYSMAGAKFVNAAAMYMCITVANMVSDVILFIIPIPTVARLKMPLAQKIGAGLMFGIGSITVATSIVRLIELRPLLTGYDMPWTAAPANVWVFTEADLFIICGSMPTWRKFLQRFAPKWLGSSIQNSLPSHSNDYNSASKMSRMSRQHRTGYSQFDDTELEIIADKEQRQNSKNNDLESQGSPSNSSMMMAAGGPSVSAECEAGGSAVDPDDASSKAIIRPNEVFRGITYTRTFKVQYSEK